MDMKGIIASLEARAADSIKADEGDYIGEDGLLYCHKCHTKKQTRIFILGEERTPFCICKCEAAKKAEEEAERERRKFEERVKKLRETGFPESDMKDWTFANDDGANPRIMTGMKNYVAKFDEFRKEGKGLLLFGKTGSGKSYAAACVANALIDLGYPVLMTNFHRIVNTVQGMFEGRQEYFDSLNRFPLLIIDDLAAERKTEYMSEIVYNVIDARCRAGLPIIITTNLTREELNNPADMAYARTYSRLMEMTIPLEVVGVDRRKQKLKNEYNSMLERLGM